MYAYARLTFFGVLENASTFDSEDEDSELCRNMARYMYVNGQYQFLSHWMLAICAESEQSIYHNVVNYSSLGSYWEPLTKLSVELKDLNKYENDAISLIVSDMPGVGEMVVVFRTDAKSWTKHFDYAKFELRERFGTRYEIPPNACIYSKTYAALKMTMKLYSFPFWSDNEADEATKVVCQKMLNTKFKLTLVT